MRFLVLHVATAPLQLMSQLFLHTRKITTRNPVHYTFFPPKTQTISNVTGSVCSGASVVVTPSVGGQNRYVLEGSGQAPPPGTGVSVPARPICNTFTPWDILHSLLALAYILGQVVVPAPRTLH